MKEIEIDGFKINENSVPYIIAEAGVNHESSLEIAEKMIVSAKKAGANAIKFQTYEPEDLVAKDSPKYWVDDKPNETQFEFFKRSSLWKRDMAIELQKICIKNEITFLSTGFDKKSIDLLDEIGMKAFKVASADITSLSLLEHIAKKNKPVILSTGASNISEIEKAIETIMNTGNDQIILLHCILSYPTPINEANLQMIKSLQMTFPNIPVGFSDHIIPDESYVIPIVCTALGGKVIEKHFTVDRNIQGNDHYHSVDPDMLTNLVEFTKKAFLSLGKYDKEPISIEFSARKNARRSVAYSQDLKKGSIIEKHHLKLLRPGTGIDPYVEKKLLGLELKNDVVENYLVKWSDFNNEQ